MISERSPISPRQFLTDYLRFGIDNRIVATKALASNWDRLTLKEQLIRGGKVIAEYGGAIEELFAFCFSLHQQCNADEEVFLFHHFNYSHAELYRFVQGTVFSGNILSLYRLPPVEELAKHANLDADNIDKALQQIGANLDIFKSEYFERDLKQIYNKLKHPFLVLSPDLHRTDKTYSLNVLTVPRERGDLVAVGIPTLTDMQSLSILQNNIFQIRDTLHGLIPLVIWKYEIADRK